jgi:UDP-GlcNAc:undecaprenyl-phosphate GlcNAc-1-phosphate transferase
MTAAGVFGTAFAVSFLLAPLVRNWARARNRLDVPNERSSHAIPTPRTGGIAIVAGLIAAIGISVPLGNFLAGFMVTVVGLAVLGGADDFLTLRAGPKLLTQIALTTLVSIVVMMPVAGSSVSPWMLLPLLVFWLTGFTNAFNFMDGINGIAASQAIVTGGTVAVLLHSSPDGNAAIAVAAVGAAAGFLPWNFPRATLFMGDAGSLALGVTLAVLIAIPVMTEGSFAAVLPALPFILDTSATLIRRLLRRERIFDAHRTHYYQRLNQLGWGHAKVTVLWSSLALLGGWAAVEVHGRGLHLQIVAAVALLAVHAVIFAAIDLRWAKRR